jgi:hypothetical protein
MSPPRALWMLPYSFKSPLRTLAWHTRDGYTRIQVVSAGKQPQTPYFTQAISIDTNTAAPEIPATTRNAGTHARGKVVPSGASCGRRIQPVVATPSGLSRVREY